MQPRVPPGKPPVPCCPGTRRGPPTRIDPRGSCSSGICRNHDPIRPTDGACHDRLPVLATLPGRLRWALARCWSQTAPRSGVRTMVYETPILASVFTRPMHPFAGRPALLNRVLGDAPDPEGEVLLMGGMMLRRFVEGVRITESTSGGSSCTPVKT